MKQRLSTVWDCYSQAEYAVGLLRLEVPEEPLRTASPQRRGLSDPPPSVKQLRARLAAAAEALHRGDKLTALAVAREARDSLRSLLLGIRKATR